MNLIYLTWFFPLNFNWLYLNFLWCTVDVSLSGAGMHSGARLRVGLCLSWKKTGLCLWRNWKFHFMSFVFVRSWWKEEDDDIVSGKKEEFRNCKGLSLKLDRERFQFDVEHPKQHRSKFGLCYKCGIKAH